MKPEPNFFLINRTLLEHSWLIKNRDWQLAWIYVIGRANYQTARVSLTEVYRELDDVFTNDQWRYFVKRCVKEGMLSQVATYNRGDKVGFSQVAVVANYAKYQGDTSARGKTERVQERVQERLTERYSDADADNASQDGALDGAKTERVRESNKESSKEGLKEVNPPTPQNVKPKRSGPSHEFDPATVPLPKHVDRERFEDFCASRLAIKKPMSEKALKGFLRTAEGYPAPILNRMLDNAIVGGWQGLFPLKPWELEEVKASAPKQGERLPVGSRVEHPTWGADVVRYYTPDGYMVLDDCGAAVQPSEVRLCPN